MLLKRHNSEKTCTDSRNGTEGLARWLFAGHPGCNFCYLWTGEQTDLTGVYEFSINGKQIL
jgi:hypothetical protein